MKKFLLFSLILSLPCFIWAQGTVSDGRVPYEEVYLHPDQVLGGNGDVIGQKLFDNVVIGTTWYDSQTVNYGNIMPRMWAYEDGTVGAIWMSAGEGLVPERGAGYNYYNGTEWGTPVPHVGPADRTGWPNYAPYGPNGEIIAVYRYIANEGPIWFFKRDVKGEGEWDFFQVNGPEGTSLVWHSMTTSGENHEYIHLLAESYDTPVAGQTNALLYFRSADGGTTWDPDGVIIDGLGIDYLPTINSLSYTWANPVGNTIAFTYGFDEWGGWVFKSNDNGDTWERITVFESVYDPLDPPTDTEPFGCGLGSSAVALDSEGKAHVVFNRMIRIFEAGTGYYYPLNADGLIYWNEDMEPLDTTIISSTGLENLMDGGYLCGYVFGYDPSVGVEIPSGQPGYANSICGFPVISIDGNDNIFIASSNIAPDYSNGTYLYRHIVANSSFDGGLTWNGMVDLNDDFQFIFSECAFPAMAPVVDNTIYFLFQEDDAPGTFEWPNEQPEANENEMYMMTVPKSFFVGIEENEVALNFELSQPYPNPAATQAVLNVVLQENSHVMVNILNATGQSVYFSDMGNLRKGSHQLRLNVENLPAGIYHCSVNVDGQAASRKIMVR